MPLYTEVKGVCHMDDCLGRIRCNRALERCDLACAVPTINGTPAGDSVRLITT